MVEKCARCSISSDKLAGDAKMSKQYQGASLLDLKYDKSRLQNLQTLDLAEIHKSEK